MTVTVNMEEVMEMESGMGKGTRKPSDMNAPKRPMSAFFQWANKTRPSIMKEHPEWGVAEIGKKLGSMWKKVPKSEVEEFQVKYDKAKKVFDGKMEKYKKGANYRKFQTELLAWKIHVTKKPFGADPNAPKRSLSAYMLYAASVRDQIIKENPEITAAEVMKEQSVWWKALSEAQRKPWNDKAATAKAEARMDPPIQTEYFLSRKSLPLPHQPLRSRSLLPLRGSTLSGSEDPSLPLCPPSSRCGSPSRSMMNVAHPLSTGSASKLVRAVTLYVIL